MKIQLREVNAEEKDVLFRLLQFSLYEESATDGNEMDERGIFPYAQLENYFERDDHRAYFIADAEAEKVLGFVMLHKCADGGHCIDEFMVLPRYRRNKIGARAAVMCFEKFPGRWEVTPSFGSEPAKRFWESVIAGYTNGRYTTKAAACIFQ